MNKKIVILEWRGMDNSERRRHIRLQSDEKLFVQVVAASESSNLVGKTYFCKALDVSESGLKVTVQHCVPEKCDVELWVQVNSTAKKYFLKGKIQWCDELEKTNGHFELGIRLSHAGDSDFKQWQYLFDGHINRFLG